MPLPILQVTTPLATQATPQTLVRLFHQTQLHWSRHLAEEQLLDLGTALFNPQLSRVTEANILMDAAVAPGTDPADAIATAEVFYQEKGSHLRALIPNPSVSSDTLKQRLLTLGWSADSRDIFKLGRQPAASPLLIPPGSKIIPARASFRHARQLAEEMTGGDAQQADAALLHLDDPHVDALLALRDGQGVAGVAVLAMGEIGRIDQLYVTQRYRRQGLGKLMLSRALEICARALFKHVLLSTSSSEVAAQAIFKDFGFEPIGVIDQYRMPPPSGLVASDFGELSRTAAG
jgi:ribosomal protein S18 acetylase RimI-like enzyme